MLVDCAVPLQAMAATAVANAAKSDPWETLSISSSDASYRQFLDITNRSGIEVVRAQCYPIRVPTKVQGLKWQDNSERQHYSVARSWAEAHLCPKGVEAIMVSEKRLFEWCVVGAGGLGTPASVPLHNPHSGSGRNAVICMMPCALQGCN